MTKQSPPKQQLEQLYGQRGATISSVARYYNVSQPTMRSWLINYNIDRKDHKTASQQANRRRLNAPPRRDILLDQYLHNSIDDLEKIYHVGQSTIYYWLRILNIELVPHSQKCVVGKTKQHAHLMKTKEQVEQAYNQTKNINVAASVLGVSYSYCRKLIHQHQLGVRTTRSQIEDQLSCK